MDNKTIEILKRNVSLLSRQTELEMTMVPQTEGPELPCPAVEGRGDAF